MDKISTIPTIKELKKLYKLNSLHVDSEERYEEMFEVLPPIWFSKINGVAGKGFACSEPANHNNEGPTFSCFIKVDNRYYSFESNLKADDEFIQDSYRYHFCRGLAAIQIQK